MKKLMMLWAAHKGKIAVAGTIAGVVGGYAAGQYDLHTAINALFGSF